jgi:hypothetical protein
VFREDCSNGDLGGNFWEEHGRLVIGKTISWELDSGGNAKNLCFADGFSYESEYGARSTKARFLALEALVQNATNRLSGCFFQRLLADRDIRPEEASKELKLSPDGTGATNIIRRYIVTASPRFPREVIQRDLLAALNKIFGGDGHFDEIQIKIHDEQAKPLWEIFLGEEKKGLISLSNSGSGLKTVLLVLLNLLVVRRIEEKPVSKCVFAFEELENNLHPALLRRLFRFLEEYAIREDTTIFLTTHSSTALDLFGVSENAQIIHVRHDGESAVTKSVAAHFDQLGVLTELGAKPSDLLQSNGILWVEGPSDCIYLKRWLDLFSEGKFRDGRDYLCAFYGGALLARTQFKSPKDADAELVNLFQLNPNVVVICDGDRTSEHSPLKPRVERILDEVRNIPDAHIWVTAAKEIENYIPGVVLEKAVGLASLPDPGKYEEFFPRNGDSEESYVESKMQRKGIDKMELAALAVPHMEKAVMSGRFEWESEMKEIMNRIEAWNM